MSKLWNNAEVWFVTGSQHLYGEETLRQVAAHAQEIAAGLDSSEKIPARIVFVPVQTTAEEIANLCRRANNTPECLGLVCWMHTFSPAKMWIGGLGSLRKPLLHLHTQYNRDLPWGEIDMDFMNLNQAAHGDREFGFIGARMRLKRKVVTGYWNDPALQEKIGVWIRAAAGWHDLQGARFARFGDNMREVAVTEGDKVAAEMQLVFSVNGYGIGDLVERIEAVSSEEVSRRIEEYTERYSVAPVLLPGGEQHEALQYEARVETALRSFLSEGGFKGFTDTFEMLHGMRQLPGLAVQRVMAAGYGFGAEGDWKTCALLRAMKTMAAGLEGGTSFMEDYTYHLAPGQERVLGAHMLEVCETIAAGKPSLEVHPLGIGGKADPVRLVFDTPSGPGINASLIDLGERFRLLVNEVDVVAPDSPLPRLPVARAVWVPKPDFATGCSAWILAGGAHHTGFSQALRTEHLEDFAEIAGIELAVIDESTELRRFRQDLRTGEVYYHLLR